MHLFSNPKPILQAVGLFGLGLVLIGFRTKAINTEALETETGNMLDKLDENLTLSDFQLKTLANQIKQQEAGQALNSIQVRTWRGMLSLDLEGQLEEKNALTFAKMQQLGKDLTNLIQSVLSSKGRALTAYCNQYSFERTDRIYTIETNLIKLSQLL